MVQKDTSPQDPSPWSYDKDLLSDMGGQQPSQAPAHLSIDAIGKANRRAQVRGSLVGLTVGVMSASLGKRSFKFNQNQAFLTAFLTGMTSAYVSTQWMLSRYLADLQVHMQLASRQNSPTE